jgi:diguanylate cyclase (GGDEF)-like protein
MLMLDLDDLKPVNDTFGHQWGDRLLKAVADTIRETVRSTDAAARYGGDEFVVLLPETDTAGGYVVGEKLRRDIASLTLRVADRNVRSTVSVGLVTFPDDGRTIEQLVAAADVAMYESKRRGKNRIVGYQTRLERVATAIDIEAGEAMLLTPAPDARTGGDPAPWSGSPGRGPSSVVEQPAVAEPLGAVEVSTASDRPAATPAQARTPGVEPATTLVEPSTAGVEPATAGVDGTSREQPWLTRTVAPRPGAQPRPRTPPSKAREQAPARSTAAGGPGPTGRPASERAIDRAMDRFASRSDEIRSTPDRPWIALPIEPTEPSDPPEPPDRQG